MVRVKEADNGKMKRKLYEKELRKLQVELCYVQDWVKAEGATRHHPVRRPRRRRQGRNDQSHNGKSEPACLQARGTARAVRS